MNIKEIHTVRCTRCKNEHTLKERLLERPFSKRAAGLMVSTCPRCGGREYIRAQTQQTDGRLNLSLEAESKEKE